MQSGLDDRVQRHETTIRRPVNTVGPPDSAWEGAIRYTWALGVVA